MRWRALGLVVVVIVAAAGWAGYRAGHQRPTGETSGAQVLIANQLIPTGTPGLLVETNRMFAPTTLQPNEVEDGAVADPSYLSGRAAAVAIFPGEQITVSDFSRTAEPPENARR